jgi:hypothetical protein
MPIVVVVMSHYLLLYRLSDIVAIAAVLPF